MEFRLLFSLSFTPIGFIWLKIHMLVTNDSLLIWVKVFSTIMTKKLSSLANEYL